MAHVHIAIYRDITERQAVNMTVSDDAATQSVAAGARWAATSQLIGCLVGQSIAGRLTAVICS